MSEEGDKRSALKTRTGLVLIAIVLVLLLVLIVVIIVFSSSDYRYKLLIGCGEIEGTKEDGGYVFKGLRYARPPVNELRWARPEALTDEDCWSGVYKADTFRSVCVQRDVITGGVKGNEDCLYVNVWTPKLGKDANLPVMVYIHGGYLMYLSGNEPGYSPSTKLAADSNMVHVSFNYRLNAFGFMALDSLSSQSNGVSGNYGLWDQVMALQWVHDNIEWFGGNPGHVTIYGHSSGATCVFALLASEVTHDLFHRAYIGGGSSILDKSLDEASKDNVKFVENAGCDGKSSSVEEYQCLMALSTEQILDAIPVNEYPLWGTNIMNDLPTQDERVGAVIVVDGELIRAPPLQAWENDVTPNIVPVVIGNMAQEIDFDPLPGNIDRWSWNDYERYVRDKLDTFGSGISDRALELYPPREKGSNPRLSYTTMVSDVRVTCPYDEIAQKANDALTSRVYRFVVTARPSQPIEYVSNARYAFHGWEMFAFFDSMSLFLEPTTEDNLFRDRMQELLTSFARTGEMADDVWQPWGGEGYTALISDDILYRHRFNKTRCDFWMDNGFFQYAWIN